MDRFPPPPDQYRGGYGGGGGGRGMMDHPPPEMDHYRRPHAPPPMMRRPPPAPMLDDGDHGEYSRREPPPRRHNEYYDGQHYDNGYQSRRSYGYDERDYPTPPAYVNSRNSREYERPPPPPPPAPEPAERSRYYADQGAERRRDQLASFSPQRRREVVEHQELVDHVHHDSPCGPAVSIYPTRNFPKRQQQQQQQRHEERWRAEEAKLAQYNNPASSSGRSHAPPPGRPGVKPPPPSARNSTPMIEISPGVSVRLRGSSETRDYVRRDEIVPAVCFACGLDLFGIQDADFLLCPQCRVVNPISADGGGGKSDVGGGGVGLGITVEMLFSLQQEILDQRKSSGNAAGSEHPAASMARVAH